MIQKKQYIVIEDSQKNQNVWEIIDDSQNNLYVITTRTTISMVEKDLCFSKEGSNLLYYNTRIIDIFPSDIELESEDNYDLWIEKQNENINPFRVFDEIDLGIGEDDEYGNDDLNFIIYDNGL